jgi:hypothetical protein
MDSTFKQYKKDNDIAQVYLLVFICQIGTAPCLILYVQTVYLTIMFFCLERNSFRLVEICNVIFSARKSHQVRLCSILPNGYLPFYSKYVCRIVGLLGCNNFHTLIVCTVPGNGEKLLVMIYGHTNFYAVLAQRHYISFIKGQKIQCGYKKRRN